MVEEGWRGQERGRGTKEVGEIEKELARERN